jgi:hypothetical protein
MNFLRATELYEEWLGARIRLIPKDLDLKHQRMRRDPFEFLRSTFYRWAQIWRDVCGDAVKGPAVLSVGDLHVENFGLGATLRAAWFGASMISTKPFHCRTLPT